MIDRDLLSDYIERFFGYGNLSAKYWFVGLEEGGDDDLALLQKRLAVWDSERRPVAVDLHRMLLGLGGTDWFGADAPLQRTWRALIRARFAAEGEQPTIDDIRRYQREQLGRTDGDTALLELLPLPVRRRGRGKPWSYANLEIPTLTSHQTYVHEYEDQRRDRLIELLDANEPRAVVTYGDAAAWRKRLNAHRSVNAKAWAGQRGRTIIICTHHPEAARSNAHWQLLGETIRQRCQRPASDRN